MSDVQLTERERSVLDQVAEFCRVEVDPHCEEWEQAENFPRAIFTRAGQAGLLGLLAPQELGGKGLRFTAYVLAIREMARHHGAFALDVSAHNSLCIGHLLAFGSEEQKRRCAPRLVRGEWLGAWALTEPNAGSDSAAIETTAMKNGDAWELTGHKTFITQGRNANILVVMAQSGRTDTGRKELSAFLVAGDQVRPVRKIPTYGMKPSETSEIRFERARAELVGERGQGLKQGLAILDRGRIGVASLAVGIAQAAFDAACRYAMERQQFGKPIADLQAIQWMLADSATEIAAADLLIQRAARMQDEGSITTKESAMAKLFAAEAATRICNRAMQIHGGRGYSRDFPIERYLRDVKLCEIGEGTSEIQRLVIARQLMKERQ